MSCAWLMMGHDPGVTREEHQSMKLHIASRDSLELRQQVRDELQASTDPDIKFVLEEVEMPPFHDEPLEPEFHSYKGKTR